MLCSLVAPTKIPYFNAPIYLENKTQIGKVDEILGPINEVYFTVKMEQGMVASSFKKEDKVYIGGDKLLPIERFLPKPKGTTESKSPFPLSPSTQTCTDGSQRRSVVEVDEGELVVVEVDLLCEVEEVEHEVVAVVDSVIEVVEVVDEEDSSLEEHPEEVEDEAVVVVVSEVDEVDTREDGLSWSLLLMYIIA
jgi:H/ACA ribonucleoprotein complex subunit 1